MNSEKNVQVPSVSQHTSNEMLPAVTGSVEITGFDCIYGRTVRIWMKVNGIQFKRITDKFENHKPIWDDVNRYFGTVDLMDANKEEELESIFKAFCLETGFNIKKLINEKAHKKIQVIK